MTFTLPLLLAVQAQLAGHVDPFIGTAASGHTFPGACVPFGLVQASPDTGHGDWDHCSGYSSGDACVWGFSQTHLSGTGCSDLGDLLIQPFAADRPSDLLEELSGCLAIPSPKADESASPGYYAVTLSAFSVRAEVAASGRSAIYRFKYDGDKPPKLLVDTQWGIGGDATNQIKSCDIAYLGPEGIDGDVVRSCWVDRRYGFSVAFSHPAVHVERLPSREGEKGARHVFSFNMAKGDTLLVKVGISAKDSAAARRNREAEIPGWDFDAVRSAASAKWEDFLSRATVEGDDATKKVWYTALYHLAIQPNDISDFGEEPFYSTFSCWDTFRAAGPMYTLIAPEKASQFVSSMLEQGRRTGYLPIWALWGEENQCMIGTHSIPMIVDAWLKGVWKGDAEDAYSLVKETLAYPHPGRRKEDWHLCEAFGYYPFDIVKGESVSRTLECCYDDACAARMAAALGKMEDASFFIERSWNWRNVFDPSLGMVRGRDSRHAWRTPYDPYALGHDHERENDFTEGNAFQYTWHVLHDPEGLFEAMGGRSTFIARLDSLFGEPEKIDGLDRAVDVTGLVGQYAHGNEPSHHVIYLYTLAGAPAKAAERLREVCTRFYRTGPDGLCGNEDCGQMSAWYLFTAMGFYPLDPCGGEYVLGAPQAPSVTLKLAGGKTFTVEARNLSPENKYVKSVTLDGKRVDGGKIRHADIVRGGKLVFEMAAAEP
ncbi:MAG: GH92 family glycosyl hydrolase [Kiritimatiellae bacterium]|nr:GH92 family glycosyl hydrolase [Kiritimatiellia bacterium]